MNLFLAASPRNLKSALVMFRHDRSRRGKCHEWALTERGYNKTITYSWSKKDF